MMKKNSGVGQGASISHGFPYRGELSLFPSLQGVGRGVGEVGRSEGAVPGQGLRRG